MIASRSFSRFSKAYFLAKSSSIAISSGADDRLDLDVEGRLLAGEMRGLIILGEGHDDLALVAGLGAFELVLEAGDEGSRAQHQIDALGASALESLAADAADEVDLQPVALLRRGALLARGVGAAAFGQVLELLFNVRFRNLGDQALQFDVLERADLEVRQDLEGELERQVAGRLQHLFHLGLIFREIELGLAGEPQVVVAENLVLGVVDRLLDDVAHDRLAIEALEMADRDLAGTEAVDAHLVLQLGELGVEFLGEFGRRKDHLIFALQPLRKRFRRLHLHNLLKTFPPPWPIAGSGMKPAKPCVLRGAGAGGGTRTPTIFTTGT